MHRLLARQLKAAATAPGGELELERLLAMVSEAYEETDHDRRRTDRSITLMVDELEALNETLRRSQALRLEAAVNSMVHGLCMFDAQQRLVKCNGQYLEMYHLPPEMGQPGTALAAIIEARSQQGTLPIGYEGDFAGHIISQSVAEGPRSFTYRFADGRVIAVTQSSMLEGGFVAIHQDITEDIRARDAIEAGRSELALQNVRFDAAINNISQGLCMCDAEEQLVICNEPYAQMYQLPAELVRPGTPFADILAHRAARGAVARQGADAYLADRRRRVAEGRPSRDEVELADGRIISMQLHPMEDGGWVATHEDVTEAKQVEARVRHLARHDALTDLPNRVLLREEMDKLESRIQRGETVAVFCLDLDHFKAVNDTLGHAVGDRVLVTVSDRLRRAGRDIDVVARLGGDEFAILLNGIENELEAASVADRIVKSLAAPMQIDGHDILIGASLGIAMAPHDGNDAESLLRNADMALYRAKSEGRGAYHFFERGMDAALQHRRWLEQGLRLALGRQEFRLVFQPLIDLNQNRVCCFEALLRWDHPERGTIPPLEFIPVAEETGIINPIGEWVLRQACAVAATWPGDVRVAVNLSAVQFKNKGLVGQVTRAIADAGLAPGRLEIEITESLLLGDTEQTLQMLHRLRALGVRISMDDFGTGYSSLSYLRSFPFDKIKIDRSFIASITPSADSQTIVKAVIGLGQSLGMATTAEGIETEEQLAAVREQGCSEAQGYLFSPPLLASGVAALLGISESPAETRRRKA